MDQVRILAGMNHIRSSFGGESHPACQLAISIDIFWKTGFNPSLIVSGTLFLSQIRCQRFPMIELLCLKRPDANFLSMRAQTLSCAQSLSRIALLCALQDMTVSAGVIITLPRESSGGLQTTENACKPSWRVHWRRKGSRRMIHSSHSSMSLHVHQEDSEQIRSRYV